MFRFPLRTSALAATSEIKGNNPYTYDDIRGLFAAFHSHLDDLLLFLKNTRSVIVSEARPDGTEVELYSANAHTVVDIHPANGLNSVFTFLRTAGGTNGLSHEQFIHRLHTTPPDKLPVSVHRKTITVRESSGTKTSAELVANITTADWLMCILIGGEAPLQMAGDALTLKLVPMAGVATRLPPSAPVPGRAFVSLPLPVETLLPVHVNGCFEISSNRRDVRCAFSDTNAHSRMPLAPTPARLK
jgi:sacsin